MVSATPSERLVVAAVSTLAVAVPEMPFGQPPALGKHQVVAEAPAGSAASAATARARDVRAFSMRRAWPPPHKAATPPWIAQRPRRYSPLCTVLTARTPAVEDSADEALRLLRNLGAGAPARGPSLRQGPP